MDLKSTPQFNQLELVPTLAPEDHLLDRNQHVYQRETGTSLNSRHQTGLLHLLKLNPSIVYFPFIGLLVSTAAFTFSYWFSKQIFSCPTWATDCQEGGKTTRIFVAHYATVQGFVSTVHAAGLTIIATSAYCFGLTATWPIFSQRPHKFGALDLYIPAARGSFSSLAKALWYFRSNGSGAIILLLVALVTIIIQLDSTLVGHVYNQQNVTHTYHSSHTMGGGIGLLFDQQNPPGPLPVAVGGALSLYTSWSENYSNEPLPELRDFWLNRADFMDVGNFSASAVQIQKDISCHGFALNISGHSIINNQISNPGSYTLSISTNMTSGPVWVRVQPAMTTWVDNIQHVDASRTISTLVFAAFNGTIESGTATTLPTDMFPHENDGIYAGNEISAIACDVDVRLIDSQLTNGTPMKNLTISNVSALTDVQGPFGSVTKYGDVAAWLAVAATTFGTSVYGTQPMFNPPDPSSNNSLPTSWTSTTTQNFYNITIESLERFINVSSGALAMTISRAANPGGFTARNITVLSSTNIPQLETIRTYLLLVPQAVLLVLIAVLAVANILLYGQAGITAMYQTSMNELVMFTQSEEIAKAASASIGKNKTESALVDLEVKFSTGKEGMPSLGFESVNSFYTQ